MVKPPQRVLLIQRRRLGDVTMSTALLEDIHRAWPTTEIDWLVGATAAPLLENHPLVHERLILDERHVVRKWSSVRARRYDCVIDVQGSWRTALLAWLSGAAVRAGWTGGHRGWAYTHKVPRSHASPSAYVVHDRQRLLAAAGVPVGDARPRLYLTADERARGEREARALSGAGRRVGILLSTRDPAREWPPSRFAAVAKALAQDGLGVLVFNTPGDAGKLEDFRSGAGDSATIAPLFPLRQFLGVLAACDVFVSANTGPAHMAMALDVPRVTVFVSADRGSASAEGWSPGWPTTVVVRDEGARCAACGPSGRGVRHTCLDGVTAEMVLGAVRSLLHREADAAPARAVVTAED